MTGVGRLNISEETRKVLKVEFDKLTTIEEKYNFWQKNFKSVYFLWDYIESSNIHDFMIFPRSKEETEILNKLIYKDAQLLYRTFKRPIRYPIENDFFKQVESAKNTKAVIEYELRKIDDFISNGRAVDRLKHNELARKYSYFIHGFKRYYLHKQEIDWREEVLDADAMMNMLSGISLAKYREKVEGYKPRKKKPEIILTGEQTVLALHYLGFCSDVTPVVKRGNIYEYFIGNFKQKSILKVFTNFPDYETEKNLDKLIDFFRSLEMNTIARQLEDKLAKLSKKQ